MFLDMLVSVSTGLNSSLFFFILWQHQSQMAMGQMGGGTMSNLAAMEQSRMLAQTLASNNDPKFQV
jgi:hypothetical protein